MSYAVDVNVLLYASDASSPHHATASAFLQECIENPEPLCLAWPTVMAYLRIATHPSIFRQPLTPREAMSNIDELLRIPHVRVLGEDEGFWIVYQRVAERVCLRGNLVPDAHLAAILLQHDVRAICTNDSDFRKFDFLRVRNPFA